MKRVLPFFLMLALLTAAFSPALAVTQITYYVNGVPTAAITQGDTLVWEADCAVGARVWFELWMDLNANQIIDSGDIQLFRFSIVDGDTTGQDGPPDLDGVNGLITSSVGAFGFAPISWIFYAEEGATSAFAPLLVNPLPNPPATISGTVTLEGGGDPSNILVTTDLEEPPFWSALTDASGNYTLNVGEDGREYILFPVFRNTYYVPPTPQTVMASGNVTGVDFLFALPACQIVGDLKDEQGNLLPKSISMGVIDLATGEDAQWDDLTFQHYQFGLNPGSYRFDFDSPSLNPDFLSPVTWNNPYFQFTLNPGDSLVRDITFYAPDTAIYATIAMNGVPVTQPNYIRVHARNDTVGEMAASNNAAGLVRLPVKGGYKYSAEIYSDDMPAGYGLPGGNYRYPLLPGDTVNFNFVNFSESISGNLILDAGDPAPDYTSFTVWVQQNGVVVNTRTVDSDGSFSVSIPNATVEVGIWHPNDYLVKPERFLNVNPNDNVTFTVNFAIARVRGKLYGMPQAPPQNIGVVGYTNEPWPNYYSSWAPIAGDSTYLLPVCEGNWVISAPQINGYSPNPEMVNLSVPEKDTTFIVDFTYTPLGVEETLPELPSRFSLQQNFPNPFNPETTIRFALPRQTQVRITVYTVLGQKVAELVNAKMGAGYHSIKWSAGNLSSGIYIYRMDTPEFSQTRKMILMR